MSLHVNGSGREPPRRLALNLLQPCLRRLLDPLAELLNRGRARLLPIAWRLLDVAEEVAGFAGEFAAALAKRRLLPAASAPPPSPYEAMAREQRRLQGNLDVARSWFDLAAAEEIDEAIGRLELAERELEAFQQRARGQCAVRRWARTWEGRVVEMTAGRTPIRPRQAPGRFEDYRILDEVLALRRRFEEAENARRCAGWTRQCA